jgi:signal transduction histidine kinase
MASLLNAFSNNQDVEFAVNDLEGNVIFSNCSNVSKNNSIEEIGYARLKNKPIYEVHAYFPIKAKSLARYTRLNGTRLVLILVVFSVSLLTSFLIYEILSVPLKKVRKAMNSIGYGNTLTSIPYYGNDELGLLCRNFEDMGKRLKKSEDEQGELIQAISHDLKTPMTSILGYMSRLIDGKVTSDEKKKEYYEIIYRKTNDLKLLLNDLEEYANLGKGMKFEKQAVDCDKFFKDMCEEMRCEVEQRGGSFKSSGSIAEKYEKHY